MPRKKIEDVSREEDFECNLLSTPVVHFMMRQSYSASLDFSWLDRAYTFNIPAWKGDGINKFLGVFHGYKDRDEEEFGRLKLGSDGSLITAMDVSQKGNAVLRACQDIMACLHKMLTRYQSSVMDCAFWHRQNHPEDKDYSSYITLRTCHCVVHSEFFSSKVPREWSNFVVVLVPMVEAFDTRWSNSTLYVLDSAESACHSIVKKLSLLCTKEVVPA